MAADKLARHNKQGVEGAKLEAQRAAWFSARYDNLFSLRKHYHGKNWMLFHSDRACLQHIGTHLA
jgi:hypothetical protein